MPLTQMSIQISDHVSLMKKIVRSLRPGGVLLLGDLGRDQRVLEDEEMECWSLKWLKVATEHFSENVSCGEDLKDLVKNEENLALGSQTEFWVNSNWVDPGDANGPELAQMMKTWFPVSRYLWSCVSGFS